MATRPHDAREAARREHERGQALGRPVRGRTEPGARGAVAQHPLRLAAGELRPRRLARARPGAAPRPGCSPTTSARACSPGSTSSTAACSAGELLPQDGRRGRPRRARGCAGRPGRSGPRRQAACRPQPQRPDRHPVQGVPARPRPGRRAARCSTSPRRIADQAERHLGAVDARPHAPPARPAGAAQPPPAGPRLAAGPRRRAAPRLGRPRRRRLAVRLRRPRRLQPRPRPGGGRRASSASRAAPPTRSTARRPATSSPSSPSSPR